MKMSDNFNNENEETVAEVKEAVELEQVEQESTSFNDPADMRTNEVLAELIPEDEFDPTVQDLNSEAEFVSNIITETPIQEVESSVVADLDPIIADEEYERLQKAREIAGEELNNDGVYNSPFVDARPIWEEDTSLAIDRLLVRKKFTLEKTDKSAKLFVSCSGSYNLFINAKLIVFDGSLSRTTNKIFYDTIEIGKHLKKGPNMLVLVCHHDTDGGTNRIGMLDKFLVFESKELGLSSGDDCQVYRPSAYSKLSEEFKTAYGRTGITYDASIEHSLDSIYLPLGESNIFKNAKELGKAFVPPYGLLLEPRPIPLFDVTKPCKGGKLTKSTKDNLTTYKYTLKTAGNYIINLKMQAGQGCEEVSIKTDCYETSNAGVSNITKFTNQAIKYICKGGVQDYKSPIYLFGQTIIITAPITVKIKKIEVTKSVYKYNNGANFVTSDKFVSKYIQKASTTADLCMRESVINSPERERAFMPREGSLAVSGAIYGYDANALKLVKKTIIDYLTSNANGLLYSCPLSDSKTEEPFSNLMALTDRGIIASYVKHSGDSGFLKELIPVIGEYLLTFGMNSDGFVDLRSEDEEYFRAHRNVDRRLLLNAMYYNACRYCVELIGKTNGGKEYAEELTARIRSIEVSFTNTYTKPTGYGSTDQFIDERANAWVVISKLAKEDMAEKLALSLATVQACTPSFDSYVVEALNILGYNDLAFSRFNTRFDNIVFNPQSTIPECFLGFGNKCEGASASGMYNLYRYVAGVDIQENTVTITPNLTVLPDASFSVVVDDCVIKGTYKTTGDKKDIVLDIPQLSRQVVLVLDSKSIGKEISDDVIELEKGKRKFSF